MIQFFLYDVECQFLFWIYPRLLNCRQLSVVLNWEKPGLDNFSRLFNYNNVELDNNCCPARYFIFF